MSYFTVAINEVLDRMKMESGTTRQQFAAKAGLPLSSLAGYYSGKNSPNASALIDITSGMAETDAARVIVAHLADETPEGWRGKIKVTVDIPGMEAKGTSLQSFGGLPAEFVSSMEAILQAAQSDQHIIAFIDEFAALMGFSAPLKVLPAQPRSILAEDPPPYSPNSK